MSNKKRNRIIILILVTIIAISIPLNSLAAASSRSIVSSITSGSYYYIRNAKSGHYLDAEQDQNFNVIQYAFTGYTNQIWKITRNSSGYYTLENQYSYYQNQGRKMLSVSTVTNNADLYYYDPSLTTQQWAFIYNSDGTFTIKNVWGLSTNQVLEVQDASTTYPYNVQRFTYDSEQPCQRWCLEEVPTSSNSTITASNLKIYQTEKTYRYDGNGVLPEDLKYNTKTQDQLTSMNWISWADFPLAVTKRRNNWEALCRTTSTQPLQNVVLDMVDKFMIGTGADYQNTTLSTEALNHETTQTYINQVVAEVRELLDVYDGDIYCLRYNSTQREAHPLVTRMRNKGINQPVFNKLSDKVNGLTMCVNGLWGNEIIVKSYTCDGASYSCVLTFTLYDHFGLNEPDIDKYGELIGFRDWYILQHYKEYAGAYKPFVTKMSFNVSFSGTI